VFGFGPATRIYVAAGATDMRKNFNGLYGLVRDHLGCDPESGHVFLFANARRNRLKLLVYDGSGLWVCAKKCIRLSNAPVVRLRLVLNLSDERSGISTEAAESGRGGEAGCGA
jgi:hypothetical protein